MHFTDFQNVEFSKKRKIAFFGHILPFFEKIRKKSKKVALAGPAECLSEQNAISPIKIGKKLRPVPLPRKLQYSLLGWSWFLDTDMDMNI